MQSSNATTETIVESDIEYEVQTIPGDGRFWYFHGCLHRKDGPAVEFESGKKKWVLRGRTVYGTREGEDNREHFPNMTETMKMSIVKWLLSK